MRISPYLLRILATKKIYDPQILIKLSDSPANQDPVDRVYASKHYKRIFDREIEQLSFLVDNGIVTREAEGYKLI